MKATVKNNGWGRVAALAVVLLVSGGTPAGAIGAGSDDRSIDELLGDVVTPKDLDAQIRKAVVEAGKKRSSDPLVEPLDVLIRNADLFVPPETMESLAEALLTYGQSRNLASRVPRLLKYGQVEFSPAALGKFNLGIRLALVHGGVSFEDLEKLLEVRDVDLEWLLPALGKTGGASALPLIRKYRNDALIIPLGNEQNIRAISCAAILAAAYAGDEGAQRTILDDYEEDVSNLPRFAFYVAWGLGEGLSVRGSKRLLAYCRHRVNQAERWLDFMGRPYLPRLIERANGGGSPAIVGYLLLAMECAPGGQIQDYVDLLAHPAPVVKERVLDRILASGDPALRDRAIAQLRGMAASPAGADRLFAVTSLRTLLPDEGARLLAHAYEGETNQAVRVRMEDMLRR